MDHLDLYLTMEAFTDFVSGVKLIVCITIMDDYIHLLKQAKILKCIPFSKKSLNLPWLCPTSLIKHGMGPPVSPHHLSSLSRLHAGHTHRPLSLPPHLHGVHSLFPSCRGKPRQPLKIHLPRHELAINSCY